MALAVTITESGGGTTYRLPVEEANIDYQRKPIHIAMPGTGNPQLEDLGNKLPTITLSGRIDDTAGTDGGTTIPSKNNLEDAQRTWFGDTITLTIGSDSYIVKFMSLRLTRKSGIEDQVWEFLLRFASQNRS